MKPFVVVATMCLLSAIAPAAYARTRVSHSTAMIEKGHAIAQSRCAACHGIGPTDRSPLDQAPPFERFAERYPIEQLAEAFAEGIVVGHNEMPPFELQPSEIEALLAYLGSLDRNKRNRD